MLPGGGDWLITRPDGVIELDLRITLKTDDGVLIYMTFTGLRHGTYFRTVPRFETAAPQLPISYEGLHRDATCVTAQAAQRTGRR